MAAIYRHAYCFFLIIAAPLFLVPSAGIGSVSAAGPDHPMVPGFERIYSTGGADPAEGGRLLLTELNCVSCHRPEGAAAKNFKVKRAPILDTVGSRIELEWLQKYLALVHSVKPGTTMPDLFVGHDEATRQKQIVALTHFLSQTGRVSNSLGDSAAVRRGEKLFHSIGCVACHAPVQNGIDLTAVSVPLGPVADKYSLASLTDFLKDPLKIRPSGRMPNFKLDDKQARDIASFFFRDKKIAANVNFAYYEGGWQKLPDFDALKPKTQGQASGFDLGARQRNDGFGFRFSGFVHIPEDGDYRFYLGSDDGSRLTVDGHEIVINDGIHPHSVREGVAKLVAGVHEVQVDYFEGGGEESLSVEIQGPGLPKQPLASITTITREVPKKEVDGEAFVFDEALAEQGRQLFGSVGCAACHQLKQDGQRVESSGSAKSLADLQNLDGGCLSSSPVKGVPHYRLSELQRTHLAAAITESQATAKLTPQQLVQRTMAQFNCYACHARNSLGGVEEARDQFFTSTMKEMGDEGRIPPALDGVADKLTANWLKGILDNGAKDRPYMLTMMPKFGGGNVGHLQDVLTELDLKTTAEFADYGLPDSKMKAIGRQFAGEKGLGCVKCHTFDRFKATGIQSIDLTIMAERLRKDWFFRYMENPQRYRPGTRMPAPWPFGQATIRDVLDGDVGKQMQAVWLFLEDGKKAGIPAGLNRSAIVLKPETAPIIYRNFIEGVSPRGIAVGYPEGVNLCFDADEICLALIWENAFIDASKHWNGRGQGFQPPLGDNVYSLVRGVPFATLESVDAAWPTDSAADLKYQFKGYRFNSSRQPVFRYTRGRLAITDELVPRRTQGRLASIERTLTLEALSPVQKLYYRAARGKKIELVNRQFVVDEHLKLTLGASTSDTAFIRENGGMFELLVPVDFVDGQARLNQLYEW